MLGDKTVGAKMVGGKTLGGKMLPTRQGGCEKVTKKS